MFSACDKENIETNDKITKQQEIVELLVSHGIEKENISFDDSIDKNNALVFNSLGEFKEFLNKKELQVEHTQKNIFQENIYSYNPDRDKKYFTATKDIDWLIKFVVGGFYEEKINEPLNYQIHSYIVGITFAISYNQIMANLFRDGSNYKFQGIGLLNYNIFIEGIGTVFTEEVKFNGTVNYPNSTIDYLSI